MEKVVSNFQGVSFRKTVSNFQGSIPWREAPPGPPDAPTGLGLLGQLHAAVPMGRNLFHVKQLSPCLTLFTLRLRGFLEIKHLA